MRKTSIIDALVTTGDKISKLVNDKEYADQKTIVDAINNKDFTEEQLLRLADGTLQIFAEIYAEKGMIGGCIFEDGVLKIKNINIAEEISAVNIDVESLIVSGKAFIEELESHHVLVTSEDNRYITEINNDSIITKYPIYSTVGTMETTYFIVTSKFWLNNMEWVSGMSFTGITRMGTGEYIMNSPVVSVITEAYRQHQFPMEYSWEDVIFNE